MQYHLFTDYYYMMLSLMVDFYRSLISERMVYAAFIFIIGLIFAVELSKLTKRIFQKIGVDKTLEKIGIKNFFKSLFIFEGPS